MQSPGLRSDATQRQQSTNQSHVATTTCEGRKGLPGQCSVLRFRKCCIWLRPESDGINTQASCGADGAIGCYSSQNRRQKSHRHEGPDRRRTKHACGRDGAIRAADRQTQLRPRCGRC